MGMFDDILGNSDKLDSYSTVKELRIPKHALITKLKLEKYRIKKISYDPKDDVLVLEVEG